MQNVLCNNFVVVICLLCISTADCKTRINDRDLLGFIVRSSSYRSAAASTNY